MRDLLKSRPPALWLLVYVGSVFVLMGSQRRHMLVIGAAAILLALGVAVYLATEKRSGRPRPPGVLYALGGVAVFYLLAAIVAAQLGWAYAVAALAAGAIPLTATALAAATVRTMTSEEGGSYADRSREDQSPVPRLGADDERPLGDSPDVHGDLDPHDLPLDNPARKPAERFTKDQAPESSQSPTRRRT